MRKLISLLLALVMVMSFATVAFAADDEATTTDTSTSQKKVGLASEDLVIYFNKTYTGNAADEQIYPVENLTFEVTDSTDENAPTLTVTDYTTDGTANPSVLAMTVGAVPTQKAGVYYYTIKETAGSTQGVTYTDAGKEINVTVWVYWEDVKNDAGEVTGRTLKKAVTFTKPESGSKVNEIQNQYTIWDLSVKKTISGALASAEQKFDINVYFKGTNVASNAVVSYSVDGQDYTINATELNAGVTKTISIKAGTTVTFENIPAGVTYTVIENEAHAAADPTKNNPATGYTVTGEVKTATALNANAEVTVNNAKDTTVETGIELDSIPFVVMMVVCAAAAVLFVIKRRSVEF